MFGDRRAARGGASPRPFAGGKAAAGALRHGGGPGAPDSGGSGGAAGGPLEVARASAGRTGRGRRQPRRGGDSFGAARRDRPDGGGARAAGQGRGTASDRLV